MPSVAAATAPVGYPHRRRNEAIRAHNRARRTRRTSPVNMSSAAYRRSASESTSSMTSSRPACAKPPTISARAPARTAGRVSLPSSMGRTRTKALPASPTARVLAARSTRTSPASSRSPAVSASRRADTAGSTASACLPRRTRAATTRALARNASARSLASPARVAASRAKTKVSSGARHLNRSAVPASSSPSVVPPSDQDPFLLAVTGTAT
ncbi:hypothetical protein KIPE111705_18115 [Kibdelosporangium persicum]